MKIGDSIKKEINKIFQNTKFRGRTVQDVMSNVNAMRCGKSVMGTVEDMSISDVDELHSSMTLTWDDYQISGIITWRKSTDGNNYVFEKYV